MPDFVYFFPFGISGAFSHSGPGLLLYCVPVGALVHALYRTQLRQALLAWLPRAVGARMRWPLGAAPDKASTILLSLAIGAATHIGWDAFTHPDTLPVTHLALLRERVSLGGYDMPVFKILQHASSLLGLIVMMGYSLAWMSRTAPRTPAPPTMSNMQRSLALAAVLASAALGAGFAFLNADPGKRQGLPFELITTSMAAGAIAVGLLCIGWKAAAGKPRARR